MNCAPTRDIGEGAGVSGTAPLFFVNIADKGLRSTVGVGSLGGEHALLAPGSMGSLGANGAASCATTKDVWKRGRISGSPPSFFVSIAYRGLTPTGRLGTMRKTGTACRAPTGGTATVGRGVIERSSGGLLCRALLGALGERGVGRGGGRWRRRRGLRRGCREFRERYRRRPQPRLRGLEAR
jgi:hypothetical protein